MVTTTVAASAAAAGGAAAVDFGILECGQEVICYCRRALEPTKRMDREALKNPSQPDPLHVHGIAVGILFISPSFGGLAYGIRTAPRGVWVTSEKPGMPAAHSAYE